MLCEHIVVSQAELNSGSGIIKNVKILYDTPQ